MSQHFTRNTVSAAFLCSKCGKETQHRIDAKRKGPCLSCLERPLLKVKPAAQQIGLFVAPQDDSIHAAGVAKAPAAPPGK